MNRNLKRMVGALLFGVVIYGGFVAFVGYRDIRASLEHFELSAFAFALGLASVNYLIRFLKWEYYLARLGIRSVAKSDSLLIFLSGFVLTITPGKVGEVFKSAVLARTHGVPMARTAPIVIAERLTDVIGVVALITIGSTGFSGGLVWASFGALAITCGIACVVWSKPVDLLLAALERGRFAEKAPGLRLAYASLRVLAGPSALLVPSLLSILAWGTEGCALHVLLSGFGAAPSLPLSLFFYATATLAGALIPVPGGLGVTEAMIQNQLVHLGHVTSSVATASMILVRFATLWWAVLVGFGSLGILRARFPALGGESLGPENAELQS